MRLRWHPSTIQVAAWSLVVLFLVLPQHFHTFELPLQQGFQRILPLSFIESPSHLPAQDDSVFTLRHVFHHADLNRPALHKRFDVIDPNATLWIESDVGNRQPESRRLSIKIKPIKMYRLKDRRPSVIESMMAVARDFPQLWKFSQDSWSMDVVNAPDVTDLDTVLTLAQMSANAYLEHQDTDDWNNIHGGFDKKHTSGFGWDADGLRGYLYADETNSTVIIGVKGTSMAIWDGEGTTRNDKENDNLFFSCCCGQQGNSFYRQVCDCASSRYTCNMTCLGSKLRQENRYYAAGRHLYSNVTALYPNSSIWLTGHSLGGSVSSMIGLTYGSPVVTFESVPDALPVNRLGIPIPPGADPKRPGQRDNTGAFHFGHTADPIFMGACNGPTASCSYAGYALESACHTGRECVWDIVQNNGTRVSILTHRIGYLIDSVIKKWNEVPKCHLTPECYDCLLWNEVTGNTSQTSTYASSTTSTKARTRTSTCQTPGWWGCLDETITSTASLTSSIAETLTTTCKTPGWFGCNDEMMERLKTAHPTAYLADLFSHYTTCETPGFFGYSSIKSYNWYPTNGHPTNTPPTSPASRILTGNAKMTASYNNGTSPTGHLHAVTLPPQHVNRP